MTLNTDVKDVYSRNELIWGEQNQKNLFDMHVMVFGIGGVGAYTAEALARSGVGKLTLVDFDIVSVSNINRQLPALLSEVGKEKTHIMKERIANINPHIQVEIISDFYTQSMNEKIFSQKIDFVADAIDSLKFKIELIETCINKGIPIISSIGAGNRIAPEQLYIADISEVNNKKCIFIRNVKHKLKEKGILSGLTVVASNEPPIVLKKEESVLNLTTKDGENVQIKKLTPGSTPFVPPVAGYLMASYIVRKLLNLYKDK